MSQIDKEATSKAGQSLQRSQKSQPRIAKVGVLLWLETQNLTLIRIGSQKYTKSLKYQGSLYHFLCRKHIFNGLGHFSWIASIMAPTTIQLIQWVEVSSKFCWWLSKCCYDALHNHFYTSTCTIRFLCRNMVFLRKSHAGR